MSLLKNYRSAITTRTSELDMGNVERAVSNIGESTSMARQFAQRGQASDSATFFVSALAHCLDGLDAFGDAGVAKEVKKIRQSVQKLNGLTLKMK